jgi:hypothetical protein
LEKVAGKLGIDVGESASELYAGLDANQDGSLNGSEVGSLLQNLFASASNTQAFVQSRGDEARFRRTRRRQRRHDLDGPNSASHPPPKPR